MNKRGDERLLSVWMFGIWIIIGIAIIGGVILFYSSDSDIRQFQADSLSNRLSNCIDLGGYINPNFFREDFNIFEECKLNENIVSYSNNFYFNISLFNDEGFSREFVYGNRDFSVQCALRSRARADAFALCSYDNFELDGFDYGMVNIIIETGSNYVGGKI